MIHFVDLLMIDVVSVANRTGVYCAYRAGLERAGILDRWMGDIIKVDSGQDFSWWRVIADKHHGRNVSCKPIFNVDGGGGRAT